MNILTSALWFSASLLAVRAVELLVGDSGFESRRVFESLNACRMAPVVAWRRMRGRENPQDVLTGRGRIDVEDLEWMRAVQAVVGGGGGLHRTGEMQARVWAVDLAGVGERLDSRGPRVDGGLRGGARALGNKDTPLFREGVACNLLH